jgi:hypothetical protein
MNANRLLENCAARAAHGLRPCWLVGLRQKALPQCFLIATTASRVFQQPANISGNPRYPRKKR